MQGLIDISKGQFSKAQEFINDAANMIGGADNFISVSARDFVNAENNLTEPVQDSNFVGEDIMPKSAVKNSNRIAGWLVLYGLRIIVLPVILIVDIVSTHNLNINTTTTTIQGLNIYMNIAIIADIIGLMGTFYIWSVFFRKKSEARNVVRIFEGYIATYYFVFAIWLNHLYSSNGLTDSSGDVGTLVWGGIIALLFIFYWTYSRRVKATFIE